MSDSKKLDQINRKLNYILVLIVWIWSINMIFGCADTNVQRTPPFDYDITETGITVYQPDQWVMMYYSPEVFEIGWGKYDWDVYVMNPWCDGKRSFTFDERTIIRVVTADWDYITTINELR